MRRGMVSPDFLQQNHGNHASCKPCEANTHVQDIYLKISQNGGDISGCTYLDLGICDKPPSTDLDGSLIISLNGRLDLLVG